MNKVRIRRIIEWLEQGAPEVEVAHDIYHFGHKVNKVKGFAMETFFGFDSTECGTTCCICGAAIAFYDRSADRFPLYAVEAFTREQKACELLDIGERNGFDLFYANDAGIPLDEITRGQAIACLRHFMETGVVDWPRAIHGAKSRKKG